VAPGFAFFKDDEDWEIVVAFFLVDAFLGAKGSW
jgi:hypothetical protein